MAGRAARADDTNLAVCRRLPQAKGKSRMLRVVLLLGAACWICADPALAAPQLVQNAPPPGYAPPPQQPPPCSAVMPTPVQGAARGAAAGAVFGAIGGNAGKGAAIGAAVGGIGRAARRSSARSSGACY
jgi:hypothetical protein